MLLMMEVTLSVCISSHVLSEIVHGPIKITTLGPTFTPVTLRMLYVRMLEQKKP